METSGTCPRGHAVEDGAVYCTVCWVRLTPEDPEVLAARQRRRRRFRLPFVAASAVLIGVAAGAVIAQTSSVSSPDTGSVVAAPATSAAVVAEPASSPSAGLVVTSQAEAATVADPVIASDAACRVSIGDQDLQCTRTEDRLVFQVCVPAASSVIEARTRANEDLPWSDVSTDAELGSADGCAADQVTADVVVDAPDAGSGDAIWRLVARDAAGERIWKSRFVATDAA